MQFFGVKPVRFPALSHLAISPNPMPPRLHTTGGVGQVGRVGRALAEPPSHFPFFLKMSKSGRLCASYNGMIPHINGKASKNTIFSRRDAQDAEKDGDLGSSLLSVEWIHLPPLVRRRGQNDTSPACRSRRSEPKMFKKLPGSCGLGAI